MLEKMKLDYVQADTGSKADVVTAISEKVKQQTALTPQTEVVETPAGKVAFEVGEMDDLFSVGANFTQRADSTNRLGNGGRKESVRTFLATAKLFAAATRQERRKDQS